MEIINYMEILTKINENIEINNIAIQKLSDNFINFNIAGFLIIFCLAIITAFVIFKE